jgi:DNA-binding NtrC family response regulator
METTVHRGRRVPARVSVSVAAGVASCEGASFNLSEGGAAVRVRGEAAALLPGTRCLVRLALPRGPQALAAEVVWCTKGRAPWDGLLELGLRFEAAAPNEGLVAYLASFSLGVAVLGNPELTALTSRLGGSARLVPTQLAQLASLVAAAEVGVVVYRGGEAPLAELVALAGGLPVVAVVPGLSPSVAGLLERHRALICLSEPAPAEALVALVERVVELSTRSAQSEGLAARLEAELVTLQRQRGAEGAPRIEGVLGHSAALARIADEVERLARLDTTVLIVGETGTGKGLLAKALHRLSRRASRPLITQNCAALPESLLDSELFGHVRGAFTGAQSDRAGIFEAAHQGTIFLDELTEMSPGMQARLLAVLQDGELRPVGAAEARRVDVRVLCASNRPLEPLVESGRFREDLYYRLAPYIVRVPPLRERRDDVAPLVANTLHLFQARYGGPSRSVSLEGMRLLEEAPWPGNVRQLQHLVERLAISSSEALISARQVRAALALPTPRSPGGPEPRPAQRQAGESLASALERIERALVLDALADANGVIAEAARALALNRSTLSRRIRQLEIPHPVLKNDRSAQS